MSCYLPVDFFRATKCRVVQLISMAEVLRVNTALRNPVAAGRSWRRKSKSFPSSKLESNAVLRGNQDQPSAGQQKVQSYKTPSNAAASGVSPSSCRLLAASTAGQGQCPLPLIPARPSTVIQCVHDAMAGVMRNVLPPAGSATVAARPIRVVSIVPRAATASPLGRRWGAAAAAAAPIGPRLG